MNKIIIEKERVFLLNWIFENEDFFETNGAGPYRKLLNINKFKNVPSLFFEIKERILKEEEINEWELDSFFVLLFLLKMSNIPMIFSQKLINFTSKTSKTKTI